MRLSTNPQVQMTRNGQTGNYEAVVAPNMRDFVNQRMAEKYGWAATVLGWLIDPAESVPIRLDRN